MKFDFAKKTAVISGAARGIGFECARQFAETGGNVAIVDILDKEGKESCLALRKYGVKAEYYNADAADFALMRRTAECIAEDFGSYDICVAAAGVLSIAPLLECSEEEINRVLSINVNGVIAFTAAAFAVMKNRGIAGKIVTISSTAGKAGGGINGNTIYGASKGAVIAYTKGLAREAAPYSINVNSVCPGPTETTMMDNCSEEKLQRMLAGNMIKRFAQPADIANSALFLASEYSRHITSCIIAVDGGLLKGN